MYKMTKEELCIRACRMAVGELIQSGSTYFMYLSFDGRFTIDWLDVVDYLDDLIKQIEYEELIKASDIEHKIREELNTLSIYRFPNSNKDLVSLKAVERVLNLVFRGNREKEEENND